MRRRPLFWHIFPWPVAAAVLSSALIAVVAVISARNLDRAAVTRGLHDRVVLLAPQVVPLLPDSARLDSLVRAAGAATATRYSVVLDGGRVVADSDEDPAAMDNHADRPEVIAAFAGDTGVSTRYSHTLKHVLVYVGLPLSRNDSIAAVLRAAVPLQSAMAPARVLASALLGAAVVVLAVMALLSLTVARRVTRPIDELTRCAERMAQGDFSHPMPIPAAAETARLAVAMNAMAEQLDERIRALIRKNNEQEAILSAMVEGVVAIDAGERIMGINAAGAAMLQVNGAEATGRLVQEAVRNVGFQRLVRELLTSGTAVEREITVTTAGVDRTLDAHGTMLRGSRGEANGVLVVLHDITRIKRLEAVRRDFVANVSHELRTPLTNIKGYVETLRHGEVEDPGERQRFLGIIAHHVDRLNSLIEDMLTLSRLEKDERSGVELTDQEIDGVVKSAMEVCATKAAARGMRLTLEGTRGLRARINASLLEQAVVNLLDNAVKYAVENSTVHVETVPADGEIRIAVRDEGPGIAPTHLPRLFERFYRIDKARSSKLGGTGLGLAIVKHIMNVHGGTVSVESRPGAGSIFSLHVPVPREEADV